MLGDNRNVLRVLHYVSEADNGCPCVVFEAFDGGIPLDAFLRAEPELSFDDRMTILQELADALAFCHRKGVIHRGLHPAAVLVRRKARGEPLEVKLKDFQLSLQTDGSLGTIHLSALSGDPSLRTSCAQGDVRPTEIGSLWGMARGWRRRRDRSPLEEAIIR